MFRRCAIVLGVRICWLLPVFVLIAPVALIPNPACAGISATWDVEPSNPSTWSSSTIAYIGNTFGGTLTVIGGGELLSCDAYIGYESSAVGSAVVVWGTTSTWTNSGDVYVGYGGDGCLSIYGGHVCTAGQSYAGFESGSAGWMCVCGTGSTWTSSGRISIGESGSGEITITGGGAVSSAGGTIGHLCGSAGGVYVDGTGSTWTSSGCISVGESGSGTLSISSGGAVSSDGGAVGCFSGSAGTVTVNGAGSTWTSSGCISIGQSGKGKLQIQNGATVNCPFAVLGENNGSNGVADVGGSGSSLLNSGALQVGTSGAGSLTIHDGGYVSNAGAEIGLSGAVTVRSVGSKWVTNGQLDVSGALNVIDASASVTASDGTHVLPNGIVSGNGLINSNVYNSGRVAPGDITTKLGTLYITGNYTQYPTGALLVGLAGTQTGQYSKLQVGLPSAGAQANVGGHILMNAIGAYIPNLGDAFNVVVTGQGGTINTRYLICGDGNNVTFNDTQRGAGKTSRGYWSATVVPDALCGPTLKVTALPVSNASLIKASETHPDSDRLFPDADKLNGTDLMCWAATAANLLWKQGWAEPVRNPDGTRMFRDENELFNYFKGRFANDGGYVTDALYWFILGSDPTHVSPICDNAKLEKNKVGKGFYSDQSLSPGYIVHEYPSLQNAAGTIDLELNNNRRMLAVSVGDGVGVPGHVVTVWKYDAAYDWGFPYGSDRAICMSDSDDRYNRLGSVWKPLWYDGASGGFYIPMKNVVHPLSLSECSKITEIDSLAVNPSYREATNGDFASGDLSGWYVSGHGAAIAVDDPGAIGNKVAQLTTGSPVTLSQSLDTPNSTFCLDFDYQFATTTGILEVFLGSTLVVSLTAPDDLANSMTANDLVISDPALLGLTDCPLSFTLDGPTGSQVFLDNVVTYEAIFVPEPSAVLMVASGLVILLPYARRRQQS